MKPDASPPPTGEPVPADQALLSAAQQEQARKACFLESVLDNTPAPVIATNREGLITSFNPAAERMLGYRAAEVRGRLNVNALHLDGELASRLALLAWRGDERACVWQAIAALEPGSDPSLQEWQLRRKGGQTVPTLLTVAELRDAAHEVVGYVGTALDITERRRLDQLKAEFISTVSHELRTPLTAISGALGLVRGGACGPLPEPVLPMLEIAHKNSLRLGYLIDDLLDMERLASGKMRFDMQVQALMPLVERAIEAVAEQARSCEVRLVVVARADELQVRVDAERLQQVIVNFLSNAAKFSPRGAQVEIGVEQVGAAARVTVSDHGPGIPEQFRSRIFHKFSQADSSDTRQKGGTGLGLAICKDLVEHMNGLIGYDSAPGAGTRFHFQLPIVQAARDFPAIVDAAPADAPRVLVVEDDHDIAQLIVLMLNRAGMAADVAGTALQAIEALQQSRYAAMTLDLLLPDQSGLVLMRHIRDLPGLVNLPVVVVSAHTADGRHSLNRELAPVDWISKPIDEQRLIRAVLRAMERRTTN
ncbi:hybrid sensor histidine kinase/response regulator [Paucibacter soli]|uniref:hybrid sensor histidine kinase/response regulator n=1 Tax=Paucibacter soli TaxID=3133433 RepID=UPI0030A4E8FC